MASKGNLVRGPEGAANIIRDAGGEIVGRTRLQKIAYLLEVAGLGSGFSFEYRHFGPYSEDLRLAVRNADALDLIDESECATNWGGWYSTYKAGGKSSVTSSARKQLVQQAAQADPVLLELAATALFLHLKGEVRAWKKTEEIKPDKATNDRIANAKIFYEQLRLIRTPKALPNFV